MRRRSRRSSTCSPTRSQRCLLLWARVRPRRRSVALPGDRRRVGRRDEGLCSADRRLVACEPWVARTRSPRRRQPGFVFLYAQNIERLCGTGLACIAGRGRRLWPARPAVRSVDGRPPRPAAHGGDGVGRRRRLPDPRLPRYRGPPRHGVCARGPCLSHLRLSVARWSTAVSDVHASLCRAPAHRRRRLGERSRACACSEPSPTRPTTSAFAAIFTSIPVPYRHRAPTAVTRDQGPR
jgi:hypothetical protein